MPIINSLQVCEEIFLLRRGLATTCAVPARSAAKPGPIAPNASAPLCSRLVSFHLAENRMLLSDDSDVVRLSDRKPASLRSWHSSRQGLPERNSKKHLLDAEPYLGDLAIDIVVKALRRKIVRLGGQGLLSKVLPVGYRLAISLSKAA